MVSRCKREILPKVFSKKVILGNMHKNGYRRAHGRLLVIGLERMDSRVVDLPVGLVWSFGSEKRPV